MDLLLKLTLYVLSSYMLLVCSEQYDLDLGQAKIQQPFIYANLNKVALTNIDANKHEQAIMKNLLGLGQKRQKELGASKSPRQKYRPNQWRNGR